MPVDARPITFAAFSESWLATWAVLRLKASGYREYEGICRNWLVPWFGDRVLAETTVEDIQKYMARQVEGGLAPRTVVNHLQVLRRIFEYAVICGVIDENPAEKALPPRVEKPDRLYLTTDQIRELIDATSPSWKLLIAMAALTGIRKGEQLALTFPDIDLERQTISITKSMRGGVVTSPKTRASVSQIPLPTSLIPLIDQRRRQSGGEGLVFCKSDGRPLGDAVPNRVLDRALEKAGLPHIRFHDLRHSWAVAHIRAGTDLRTLAALGRWSSPQTLLETYSHVIGIGGDAVRRFDEFMNDQV